MIIEQYTDPAGFTRTRWRTAIGEDILLKHPFIPTQQQLQDAEAAWISNNTFRSVVKVNLTIEEDVATISKIIIQIKNNPTTTLAQLNTYLSTLHWNEEATITFFIYAFGRKMADRNEIDLGNVTQSVFWNVVRDYIVDTPNKKLAKLIFGNQDAIG